MSQGSSPSSPSYTNVRLEVAGESLPVRLVSSPPTPPPSPLPPGKRLVDALGYVLSDPFAWLILIGLIIFSVIPWAATLFLSIPTIKAEQINRSELGHAVEHPSFIVTHETEPFSITLINRQPISLTHVSATLVFSDDMPVSSETTVVEFEDLAYNEQKTGVIHFTFKQPVQVEELKKQPLVEPVEIILEVNADQFAQTVSTTYTLDVVHLPWAKTVGRWLGGGFLVGLPGVFLWMLRGAFKDVFPE